ncbi:hypothetical protein KY084_05395 [Stakelama sp. CBK3Z-3]|uniref:Type II secretion system protein M n=1 Tax=Stakelama flava TaxID=2860338 RepID=A0ABS6XJI1_9SPHN|nr:hypothetical protein [Stakelama flava]MBW4330306.1 hypothetical protein [Stakelama flava]
MGHLIAGALIGLIAAALMTPMALGALDTRTLAETRLNDMRYRVTQARSPRQAVLDDDQMVRADTLLDARRRIADWLRRDAARQGVLVESVSAGSAPDGLVAMQFRISGGEDAVLAMADRLERGKPLVRFVRWRVEAIAQGKIRLDAELVVPWRG